MINRTKYIFIKSIIDETAVTIRMLYIKKNILNILLFLKMKKRDIANTVNPINIPISCTNNISTKEASEYNWIRKDETK